MKPSLFVLSFIFLSAAFFKSYASDTTRLNVTKTVKPDKDNGGLKLPKGFGALVVADNLGQARHLAVNSNGDIYVKLNRLKNGRGIVRLHDQNGDGKADVI